MTRDAPDSESFAGLFGGLAILLSGGPVLPDPSGSVVCCWLTLAVPLLLTAIVQLLAMKS